MAFKVSSAAIVQMLLQITSHVAGQSGNKYPYYGRYVGMLSSVDEQRTVLNGIIWISSENELLITDFTFQPPATSTSNVTFIIGPLKKNESFIENVTPDGNNGVFLDPIQIPPRLARPAKTLRGKQPTEKETSSIVLGSARNRTDPCSRAFDSSDQRSRQAASAEPEPSPTGNSSAAPTAVSQTNAAKSLKQTLTDFAHDQSSLQVPKPQAIVPTAAKSVSKITQTSRLDSLVPVPEAEPRKPRLKKSIGGRFNGQPVYLITADSVEPLKVVRKLESIRTVSNLSQVVNEDLYTVTDGSFRRPFDDLDRFTPWQELTTAAVRIPPPRIYSTTVTTAIQNSGTTTTADQGSYWWRRKPYGSRVIFTWPIQSTANISSSLSTNTATTTEKSATTSRIFSDDSPKLSTSNKPISTKTSLASSMPANGSWFVVNSFENSAHDNASLSAKVADERTSRTGASDAAGKAELGNTTSASPSTTSVSIAVTTTVAVATSTTESLKNSALPLQPYYHATMTLKLPPGKRINEFNWLTLWDNIRNIPLSTVLLPNGPSFTPPKPVFLKGLTPATASKDVRSGPIEIIDTKTIRIHDFYYEGDAPGAWFMVGQSVIPNGLTGQAIPILMPDGSYNCDFLEPFCNQTITLKLPADTEIHQIFWLSVFCVPYGISFSHRFLPYKDIFVPAALTSQTSEDIPSCIVKNS